MFCVHGVFRLKNATSITINRVMVANVSGWTFQKFKLQNFNELYLKVRWDVLNLFVIDSKQIDEMFGTKLFF